MSVRSSAALLMLSLAFVLPSAARGEQAVPACAKAALKQLIIFDKLQDVRPVKDKKGNAYATEVLFRGKLLGKKGDYRCVQTTATGAVTVEPYRADAGLSSATVKAAQSACTKAAQAKNLSVGKIVGTTAAAGGKQAVVEMSVFDKSGAKTATCTYDIATGRTALDVKKPATR